MKMKKITIIALILTFMAFTLVGCKKVANIETQEVEVYVVDEYHRNLYVTLVPTGKGTVTITHPAVYEITVSYEGMEFVIKGRNTYNKYNDKVGETTVGTLEITTYDDGSIDWDIVELK